MYQTMGNLNKSLELLNKSREIRQSVCMTFKTRKYNNKKTR